MTAIGPIPAGTNPNILVAWGARAEDAHAVAARLTETLTGLDALSANSEAPAWSTFPQGEQLPTGEALVEFILDAVPKDDGGKPTPALGFMFDIAKAASEQSAGMSISFFVGASVAANRVQLSLRSNSGTQLEGDFRSGAHDILDVLIGAWQPDEGTAGTVAQTAATTLGRSGPPKVAAVTWLSERYEVPEQVPGAVVTRSHGGSTLTLGSGAEADTSVEAARAVQQFLIDQETFTARHAVR